LIGTQHFTKPPPRYNDASIVKSLEEDGIGRPSTYAPTIFTLLSREYVERSGGALIPTELGEIVLDQLMLHFPDILNIEFTALMEEKLDEIEEGDADWVEILKNFYSSFHASVEKAQVDMKDVKQKLIETDEICEKCGKPMVVRWGRFGKFIACSGFPECKNTKAISTGVACPESNCDGTLVKRKSRKGRSFYGCSHYPKCNHISNKLPKPDEAKASSAQPTEGESPGH